MKNLISATMVAALAVLAMPHTAKAWIQAGVAVPPIIVGAPPVYVAPPVAYAPAPPPYYYHHPHRFWVPAHWRGPYLVPGHWAWG